MDRTVWVDSEAVCEHSFTVLGGGILRRQESWSLQFLVGAPSSRCRYGGSVGVVLRAYTSDGDRETVETHDCDDCDDGYDAREPAEDDVAPFGRAILARACPQAGLQLRHLDRYVGADDVCLKPGTRRLRPFAAEQCTRSA